ncbi:MAG: glutaredoxin family protein [Lysinibacillus sp.]
MKLYTKTICPKCLWVKSELMEAGIVFETVNIDHNQDAFEKLTSANILTVPVLEVDGSLINEMPMILAAIEKAS